MFELVLKSKPCNENKSKCEQQEITSNKTSNECHIYWKKRVHMIPIIK